MIRASAAIGAMALACAAPAIAQLGATPSSPPPHGLGEGESAGYPKGHYAGLEELPDWGGIWFGQFRPGAGGGEQPKLKGQFLAEYEAYRQSVIDNDGVVPRSGTNCSPPGMPTIMQMFQYPYEFLFTPGRVTVNQEAYMQTRTIWTDGREHPPMEELDPTYMGHSIGHWEGDVLVVDTVAIEEHLDLQRGMGRSPELRVVERIYLDPEDPDVLVNDMTLYDPIALEEPFNVTARYGRDRNGALIEFQCSENDRNPVDEEGYTLFE